MKVKRAASIPLVLHDPYFSIWSGADHLYDADPEHWCGARQQMRGYVTVDGAVSCFLGDREYHEVIPQKEVEVTPTSTEYRFENEKIILTVRFTSPLLADDPVLVSRPCTYVDFAVEMTKKVGVAAVPGTSFFNENVNNIVRLHFAKQDDTLYEALNRLADIKKKMA